MNGLVFTARPHDQVEVGGAAFNSIQRRALQISNGDMCRLVRYAPTPVEETGLSVAVLEVDFVGAKPRTKGNPVDADELAQALLSRFARHFLTLEQTVVVEWHGDNLSFKAVGLEAMRLGAVSPSGRKDAGGAVNEAVRRGMLGSQTQVDVRKAPGTVT